MTRAEFMNEVVKTYYENDCTVPEAIDITADKLKISDAQFKEWFGRGRNETLDSSRGRVS